MSSEQEVETLLDSLIDDESENMDIDRRVKKFGQYAGGIALVVAVVALFVGPWRWFDVTIIGSGVPIAVRESANTASLVAPLAVIGLVSMVFGAVYRATTADRPDDYRTGIAYLIVEVLVVAAIAGYLLLLLVAAGNGVLQGEFVGAVLLVVFGLVGLLFFSFFEILALLIAVGIPAYIGVYVGDLAGSLLSTQA